MMEVRYEGKLSSPVSEPQQKSITPKSVGNLKISKVDVELRNNTINATVFIDLDSALKFFRAKSVKDLNTNAVYRFVTDICKDEVAKNVNRNFDGVNVDQDDLTAVDFDIIED